MSYEEMCGSYEDLARRTRKALRAAVLIGFATGIVVGIIISRVSTYLTS